MKIQLALVLAVVMGAAYCWGQADGTLKTKPRTPILASADPVTEAEATATFDRLAGLMHTVLHIAVPPRRGSSNSKSPISRSEVVAEFVRLYRIAEPYFVITPKRVRVDVPRLVVDKPSEKAGLTMMIERGCVGNYGPLATGKKSTLTVADFGDSIGYFLSRIGECTHTPSTKWTPYLHG